LLPWIFYFLSDPEHTKKLNSIICLALLLSFQFIYGQLQFSLYVCWLILGFICFFTPKEHRLKNLKVAIFWGTLAIFLSSYQLFPVIDNLYFNDFGSGHRTSSLPNPTKQLVPDFYLMRLILPELFLSDGVPWWPLWSDNWSMMDSFPVYQGLAIPFICFFGIFLKQVPIYFRGLYVFLIVVNIFSLGIVLSFIVNFGASVPYGRVTSLIAFIAPILCAYTIIEIIKNRRIAIFFTIYVSLLFLALIAFIKHGFPSQIVEYAFQQAKYVVPSFSGKSGEFISSYRDIITENISPSRYFAAFIAAISTLYLIGNSKSFVKFIPKILKFNIWPGLLLISACYQAITLDLKTIPRANNHENLETSVNIKHPAEIALEKLVDSDKTGLITNRIHLDIYFGEQRQASLAVDGKQIYETHGANPSKNRFRLLPNFLAGNGLPVTTGYSSVMPQERPLSQLMVWNHGVPGLGRAIGERGHLHPGFLDTFAIKWVVRHQDEVISKINNSRQPWETSWESAFISNSTLKYQDDAFKIYEYTKSQPTVNFPNRLVFGDNAVSTFNQLEPVEPWTSTGVLPKNLQPLFDTKLIRTTHGVDIIDQHGTVMSADGQAGRLLNILVDTPRDSVLSLGIKYDKWWKVYVNGEHAPLLRINGIFGAVLVPAGVSSIQIKLSPLSAFIGIFMSATTLAFLLVCLLLLRFNFFPLIFQNSISRFKKFKY
jgi:hypothetical protein